MDSYNDHINIETVLYYITFSYKASSNGRSGEPLYFINVITVPITQSIFNYFSQNSTASTAVSHSFKKESDSDEPMLKKPTQISAVMRIDRNGVAAYPYITCFQTIEGSHRLYAAFLAKHIPEAIEYRMELSFLVNANTSDLVRMRKCSVFNKIKQLRESIVNDFNTNLNTVSDHLKYNNPFLDLVTVMIKSITGFCVSKENQQCPLVNLVKSSSKKIENLIEEILVGHAMYTNHDLISLITETTSKCDAEGTKKSEAATTDAFLSDFVDVQVSAKEIFKKEKDTIADCNLQTFSVCSDILLNDLKSKMADDKTKIDSSKVNKEPTVLKQQIDESGEVNSRTSSIPISSLSTYSLQSLNKLKDEPKEASIKSVEKHTKSNSRLNIEKHEVKEKQPETLKKEEKVILANPYERNKTIKPKQNIHNNKYSQSALFRLGRTLSRKLSSLNGINSSDDEDKTDALKYTKKRKGWISSMLERRNSKSPTNKTSTTLENLPSGDNDTQPKVTENKSVLTETLMCTETVEKEANNLNTKKEITDCQTLQGDNNQKVSLNIPKSTSKLQSMAPAVTTKASRRVPKYVKPVVEKNIKKRLDTSKTTSTTESCDSYGSSSATFKISSRRPSPNRKPPSCRQRTRSTPNPVKVVDKHRSPKVTEEPQCFYCMKCGHLNIQTVTPKVRTKSVTRNSSGLSHEDSVKSHPKSDGDAPKSYRKKCGKVAKSPSIHSHFGNETLAYLTASAKQSNLGLENTVQTAPSKTQINSDNLKNYLQKDEQGKKYLKETSKTDQRIGYPSSRRPFVDDYTHNKAYKHPDREVNRPSLVRSQSTRTSSSTQPATAVRTRQPRFTIVKKTISDTQLSEKTRDIGFSTYSPKQSSVTVRSHALSGACERTVYTPLVAKAAITSSSWARQMPDGFLQQKSSSKHKQPQTQTVQ